MKTKRITVEINWESPVDLPMAAIKAMTRMLRRRFSDAKRWNITFHDGADRG